MTKFEQDKIGRKEIVEKISSLVDNLTKDEHFCLALDGSWGSGKSFVLGMIEEKLIEHKEYTIIKYDAWENSFYEDPLIAILSCIIDSIQEKLSEIQGFKEAFKQFGKETWKNFVEKYPHAKILTGAIRGISNIIKIFNNPFSKDNKENSIASFKSYKDLLNEVKECLNSITAYEEYEGKQNKLIILVDEIDRCLPNEQIKILERLYHLFDIKNSIVIVALNKTSIVNNMESSFDVNGKEYLKKFFDFNFKLSTSSYLYLRALYKQLLDNLNKLNSQENWDSVFTASDQCLKYGNKYVIEEIDNRELTRYYDAIIKACNSFGWERLTKSYLFFLLLGIYIRKNISSWFLTIDDIKRNQLKLDEEHMDDEGRVVYSRREMPYFDYIDYYFGFDRRDIPEEIKKHYTYDGCPTVELSWDFNVIVCYSIGADWDNISRRIGYNANVDIETCKELRDIVMLYGGGEE